MPIVRLPQGELRDEIRQPLYDTIDLDNAVTYPFERRFFQTVTGKDITKTNLRQPGSLETAVSFRVQGLGFDAQNAVLANAGVIPTLLNRSGLSLTIGEKNYWQGPARFAGGRMYASVALDAGAAPRDVTLQQYGWASVQSVILQGRHVIDINPLQAFFATWIASNLTAAEAAAATPAAATNVSFVFSLKGLLRRPVQ